MSALLAAGVGAAFGGSALSSALGFAAAEGQREFLKHRYQHTVKDLRKAGLNPILATRITPPGGVPGIPPIPDMGSAVTRGTEAAKAGTLLPGEKRLLEQQRNESWSRERLNYATAAEVGQRTANEALKEKLLAAEIPSAQAMADFYAGPAGRAAMATRETGRAVMSWSPWSAYSVMKR